MMYLHNMLIDSGYLIKIIDEAGGFIQYIPGLGWFNTIGEHEPTEGYYIKVNDNVDLEIIGIPVPTPFEISLLSGWNIFSYPIAEPQNALDAVQQLVDDDELIKVISETGGFIQYIPGLGWFNTIINFEPDEGYYIKVNTTTSLTLDDPSGSAPLHQYVPPPLTTLVEQPFANNPYIPMNIVVNSLDIRGRQIQQGDELAVYDNGRLVGTGVISGGDQLSATIVVTKDDPTTELMDGYITGDNISMQYISEDLSQPLDLVLEPVFGDGKFADLGTFVTNVAADATSISENVHPKTSITCYPNPAKDQDYCRLQRTLWKNNHKYL